jgi:hypothetical protein
MLVVRVNVRCPPTQGLGAVVAELRLQRARLADSLRQLDELIAEVQSKAYGSPSPPLAAANDEASGFPTD